MDEMEKSRIKDTEGRAQIESPIKKPTEESIIASIEATTEEMVIIANLKEALANYLLLDDIYEYEDPTAALCLILGRLEMSLVRRKQSLDEDREALLEL